jgi:hypothetical protein
MKLRLCSLIFLLAVSCAMPAQTFRWESSIEPVLIDGFHRILLPPEVCAPLRADMGDIRIVDKEGNEVPYLIYKDTARRGLDRFVPYPIVETQYKESCCSHIVVKNTLANAIDCLVLEVNSADAHRSMTLSGSYNGKQWFALKDTYDRVSFDGVEKGEKKTTTLLRFQFPRSAYPFYKFDFDDWRTWWHDFKYPVFVVRAGYTEPVYIPEETLECPVPVLGQVEDRKAQQSLIRLSFPEAEYIDHLQLNVVKKDKSIPDYYRAANVYEWIKKDSAHSEEHFLGSTILSLQSGSEFNLPHIHAKDLLIRISNLDDKPLAVTEAHAFAVKQYLVADLSTLGVYTLRYGCDTLAPPHYDLQHFRAKIPLAPRIVNVSGPRDTFNPASKPKNTGRKPGFFDNKSVIWIALVLVGLVLALMAVRILKDMKNKN